jgi:predicted nucleic acid-binding protein
VILVDTSVWQYAVRRARPKAVEEAARWDEAQALPETLDRGLVLAHLWVYAELLLGGMPRAAARLYLRLPRIRPVGVATLIEQIERSRPAGIGLVDAALLGAALANGCRLWTLDRELRKRSIEHGVVWSPHGP